MTFKEGFIILSYLRWIYSDSIMLRIRKCLRHLYWTNQFYLSYTTTRHMGMPLLAFHVDFLFQSQLKDGGLKPVSINNHEWVMCWKFFFRNIAYSLRKWNSLKLLNLVSQLPGPRTHSLETWSPSISLWDTRSYRLLVTLSKDFMLLTRTMAHVAWQTSATQAYPQPWCSCISLVPAMVESPLPMKTSIPVPPTPLWLLPLFYSPWMMSFPTLSNNGNSPLDILIYHLSISPCLQTLHRIFIHSALNSCLSLSLEKLGPGTSRCSLGGWKTYLQHDTWEVLCSWLSEASWCWTWRQFHRDTCPQYDTGVQKG